MRDEPYVDVLRVTRLAHVGSPGIDSRKFELRPVISTRLLFLPVFTVYILESASSGRFYVGHTVDLEDRLLRLQQDRSASTRGRRPWLLVYTECFATRSGAVCREHPERTGV